MVYKLVEVDGRPVAKRSEHKQTHGGRKRAYRTCKPSGTAVEEVVVTGAGQAPDDARSLQRPLVRAGDPVPDACSLTAARETLRAALTELPWEGLKLSRGEPAIPTRVVSGDRPE
jgi:nicotinate phosphoribosyltransferase